MRTQTGFGLKETQIGIFTNNAQVHSPFQGLFPFLLQWVSPFLEVLYTLDLLRQKFCPVCKISLALLTFFSSFQGKNHGEGRGVECHLRRLLMQKKFNNLFEFFLPLFFLFYFLLYPHRKPAELWVKGLANWKGWKGMS